MLNDIKLKNTLQEKLDAIEYKCWNAEVQWDSIKKCVLGNIRDLVGEIDRIPRKP
jgi:hypothetical protein